MMLFLILILLFYIAVLLYFKVSLGICKCSKHLVGKVVIVTGANTGIGYEVAKDMAHRGARVILACKLEEYGKEAKDKIVAATGNLNVDYKSVDLSSLNSVRAFCDDILKTETQLDILINNAGTSTKAYKITKDGLLLDMQVNYFGHFLLTYLLLPLLKKSSPSRIINTSSILHKAAKLNFDNLNMVNEEYNAQKVYNNSKLCNLLMSMELARRLSGTGVTANSLHPGAVYTKLMTNHPVMKFDILRYIVRPFMKSSWEGAQTTIYLAVSPEVEGVTGGYFVDCKKTAPSITAQDDHIASKLWEVSERLVGLN
ncbi:retinol dehydrogenase 12-like [Galleria mellonella]|uniref:Retinol dehydrogenase 12-like n=1 Tax=Galleria mellonella TaxID=7137 RepID=A0A6J1WZA9_GALME|nr:retinol dehydrogenase 12-like [Galleria mellonella]